MPLTLRSPAVDDGGVLPVRFTCDGDGVSPPLAWEQVPAGTRSLVLIVDDPDAPDPARPQRVFVHWVVYDLPPAVERLAEAASPDALPDPARQARNDRQQPAYTPACPPIGRHRYFFHLHALDAELGDLGPEVGRREVEAAMRDHVLERATFVATYAREDAGAR